jgi:PAS domain S-box-containing protein
MIEGAIIGIDISAPQVHMGRIKDSKVEKKVKIQIDTDQAKNAILDDISNGIKRLINDDVLGIGVGVPSVVNVDEGVVYEVSRIPSWKQVKLKAYLESQFNVPVYVNNDANCFATGIKYFGQGRDYKNIIGLIIGEGMGAGVIVDQKLISGPNCGVGEFGRLTYRDANYESYCSTKFFSNYHDTTFSETLKLARKKDKSALRLFEKYGYYLGTAIKSILYTYDPELIVLGGSAISAYEFFKDSMNLQMTSFTFKRTVENIKIDTAKGENFGILGAAALYLDANYYEDLNQMREKQEKIQTALNQAEKQYYKVFNTISDPIFVIDKETHKFLDCNESVVQRVYGYSKNDLDKMTPLDLLPETDKDRDVKNMDVNDPEKINIYKHVTKSGDQLDVEIHSDDIEFNGRSATISVVRDISERMKIERAANQRARQSTLILKVAERINGALDINTVLPEIVTSVQESFDYYGVMLLLMNKRKKALVLNSISGAYAEVFPSDLTIKVGEGMIGAAATERKIQVSGDVTKDPNYVQKAGEVTRSELSVPIISDGNVIGVLDLQSDRKDNFNELDVSAAWTLSSQIAIAIKNARLYDRTQQDLDQMRKAEKEIALRAAQSALVYEVGQRINSSLDIEQLLSEIVHSICETFDYYGVMLLMAEGRSKKLVLRSIAGGYEKVFPSDLTIKYGEGMIGTSAKSKAIQISNDVTKDPNYVRKAEEVTMSEMSVPIISDKKVIGVLDFQNDHVNAFSDSDSAVAWTLSSQIATALDNAKLFSKAQEELNERKQAEKELRSSRNSLQKAKRETDSILQNVDEGLLLLNSKYKIGSQYSTALEEILFTSDLAGKSILEILESKIPESLLESTEEYLELMFDPSIDEESLNSLNPLSQTELIFPDHGTKHLSFKFRRIMTKKKINELIVAVRDVTEQVLLEQKLEESHSQSKRQMDWLLSILHVEPQLLKEFIDGVNAELKYIDENIRKSDNKSDYRDILEIVYRSMHLIKGNASVLDLKFFVEKAHIFEEKLSEIRDKTQILGSDFVPLVLQLNDIRVTVGELNNLIERISKIHSHFRPKRSYESEIFIKSIQNLVNNLSSDLNKMIYLDHTEFDAGLIPYEYKLTVREILIQLVRNAIYHGIETSEERAQAGKPLGGTLIIKNLSTEDSTGISFCDDGRGLQIEKLRKKAIESKRWPADTINSWNDQEVIHTIFTTGISTLDRANLVAGRGVGLDIVRDKVDRMYGQIEVMYEKGKYTEFQILFPKFTEKESEPENVTPAEIIA